MKLKLHAEECTWLSLHTAIGLGDVKQTAKLLQNGINVNCQNTRGETPLNKAIEQQNVGLVRLLVKYGADLTITPPYGVGVLYQAVETGNLSLIKFILKHSECHRELFLQNHLNPIMRALIHEQIEVTRLLLEKGATINATSKSGEAPLFIAAMGKNADRQLQLAILLFHYGADASKTDIYGHVPVHYSWHNSFTAYLAEYGVTRKTVNSLKSLSRHVVLKQLVTTGASDESTPLDVCVRRLPIPNVLYDYLIFVD